MPPATAHGNFRVTPLAGALGAEIDGVNLSDDLDDATIAAIRRVWLDHLVVFFRDQALSPERFLAFARRFGETAEYPFVRGIEGFPEIIAVTKLPEETVNFGGLWHTDSAYLTRPPMATLLLAREVPATGGDTLWANQYAAFEALSQRMQHLLCGLTAVHSSALPAVSRTREARLADAGREHGGEPAAYLAEHPVVRTHPETGRKALYVNPAHTLRFGGMSDEESRPLLEWLFTHSVRAEHTCRFQWRTGSLALWDNRCTLHYPLNDYPGQRRVMHRITLAGDVPR